MRAALPSRLPHVGSAGYSVLAGSPLCQEGRGSLPTLSTWHPSHFSHHASHRVGSESFVETTAQEQCLLSPGPDREQRSVAGSAQKVYTEKDMWEILEHRRASKQLGRLPGDILKRYEVWKNIVALSGPEGLRKIRGFRDEALRGEQKGNRSSRLSKQYRVIYRVEATELVVLVIEVNAHDDRSRR